MYIIDVKGPCQLPQACKGCHASTPVAQDQGLSQCLAATSLLQPPRHVDNKITLRADL